MNKKQLDLDSIEAQKIGTFLANGQTVLISCCATDQSQIGLMTLSWFTPTSKNPFLVSISVGHGTKEDAQSAYRTCQDYIDQTKEFGINVPLLDMKDAVMKIGTCHSDEVDKFAATGLHKMPSKNIKAPLIDESCINVECKVIDQFQTGDHTVFIGEPVAMFVNEDFFDDDKIAEKYRDKKQLIHAADVIGDRY